METGVALPTLTPQQISFGWGKKLTCRVGRCGIEGVYLCVSGWWYESWDKTFYGKKLFLPMSYIGPAGETKIPSVRPSSASFITHTTRPLITFFINDTESLSTCLFLCPLLWRQHQSQSENQWYLEIQALAYKVATPACTTVGDTSTEADLNAMRYASIMQIYGI